MRHGLKCAGAMLAMLGMGQAQAADTQCLTADEMHGMVGYFMPTILDEVVATCAKNVAADSYTNTGLIALAKEMQGTREASWPMARQAFFKFSRGKSKKRIESLEKLSDATLRPLVDEMLKNEFSPKLGASDCGEINDVMEALAPLKPEQSVHLISVLFAAVTRKDANLASCPRQITATATPHES